MLHHDRTRAGSFGQDAERYDRARPTYPAALIDELIARHPRRVLDVGCGTGIAAQLLADRGCDVVGLEPDGRMAAVAHRRGLQVEVATFEDWAPSPGKFDLITSAQAWHWVDPAAGATKAASLLEPTGRIGLFWNVAIHQSELQKAFDRIYEQYAADLAASSVVLGRGGNGRFGDAARALRVSGHFADVVVKSYHHAMTYSTDTWLDQLGTHSDHATLDSERRDRLFGALRSEIDRAGGHFVVDYDAWLVTARLAGPI